MSINRVLFLDPYPEQAGLAEVWAAEVLVLVVLASVEALCGGSISAQGGMRG